MSDAKPETAEPNFEELAAADGWVPQEAWKGPPDRWVDAKTFVERGAQILPIVQAKNRKLIETVEELKSTVNELKEGNKAFLAFHEQTLSKAQKEREQLLHDLEAERAKAITEGDGQTFTRADQKIQELRAQQPVQQKREEPPEVRAWKSENSWYDTDPELAAVADGLSDVVARENPALKGRAFLDKLTERVKTVVPHKFQNARRENPITEGHERKGSGKKGRTFEDLPADAKAAFALFKRTMPGFSEQQYLAQYTWEQE